MLPTTPQPDARPDPWEIAETMFPRQRSRIEQLHFCVNYAALAPSSHNSQPWLFRVQSDQIELCADLRRALPAVDPDFRELVISCGAALRNLVLALTHFGYESSVEIVAKEMIPAKNDDKVLLARVHVVSSKVGGVRECDWFHMIPRRRTSRMSFERRAIPGSFLVKIDEIARSHGVWLQPLQEKRMRAAMADFVAQANRVQIADKKFRDELSSWSSSTRRGRRDGMPGYATGASFVLTYAGHFLFRTFRFPDWQARRDRNLVMEAPALLVLGTNEDSVEHWLRAGEALEAISLHACLDSIWMSFLNQPIEVNALRGYLTQEFGLPGFSQLLIRMGYGPVGGHTPRRPLEEILL